MWHIVTWHGCASAHDQVSIGRASVEFRPRHDSHAHSDVTQERGKDVARSRADLLAGSAVVTKRPGRGQQ